MKSILFSAILTLFATTVLMGQNTQANGQNVTYLKFGDSSSSFLGSFVKKGDTKQWVEEGTKQGTTRYKFLEINRDDWSVYLVDDSRGVNIQLDLHTKKVMYSDDDNTTPQPMYDIKETFAGVNGWTVREVRVGPFSKGITGTYSQKNATNWVEKDKAGKEVFSFTETGRDDWSVYLKDSSRGVSLQLDLHTKKVMYSDKDNSNAALYAIKRMK